MFVHACVCVRVRACVRVCVTTKYLPILCTIVRFLRSGQVVVFLFVIVILRCRCCSSLSLRCFSSSSTFFSFFFSSLFSLFFFFSFLLLLHLLRWNAPAQSSMHPHTYYTCLFPRTRFTGARWAGRPTSSPSGPTPKTFPPATPPCPRSRRTGWRTTRSPPSSSRRPGPGSTVPTTRRTTALRDDPSTPAGRTTRMASGRCMTREGLERTELVTRSLRWWTESGSLTTPSSREGGARRRRCQRRSLWRNWRACCPRTCSCRTSRSSWMKRMRCVCWRTDVMHVQCCV